MIQAIPRPSMYHRRMSADLLRGHLDRLLLAVLAEAPGHGYELSQRLAQRSGGELAVHEGSLYPALHRLERGRLVESMWSTRDGRRRRVYRLTPAGRRAVRESRREWRAFSAAVDRVLGRPA
jgi:PadR family transcriptional regulator, regulatory protein PadR